MNVSELEQKILSHKCIRGYMDLPVYLLPIPLDLDRKQIAILLKKYCVFYQICSNYCLFVEALEPYEQAILAELSSQIEWIDQRFQILKPLKPVSPEPVELPLLLPPFTTEKYLDMLEQVVTEKLRRGYTAVARSDAKTPFYFKLPMQGRVCCCIAPSIRDQVARVAKLEAQVVIIGAPRR